MELYIYSMWTKLHENAYVAEAAGYSENGNHAVIYSTGETADEADTKLTSALHELGLIPEVPFAKDKRSAGTS